MAVGSCESSKHNLGNGPTYEDEANADTETFNNTEWSPDQLNPAEFMFSWKINGEIFKTRTVESTKESLLTHSSENIQGSQISESDKVRRPKGRP